MRLFGRILAVSMFGLVAILFALLWLVGKADQARLEEVQGLRDSYLLHHLRATAENYLATGLQLEQMQALQDVIEREQFVFSDISVIDVYSTAGVVLFSTEQGSRGSAVPNAWKQALAQPAMWSHSASLQRHIGQRFDNDLGQPAGGIAITLTTVSMPRSLAQWKSHAQTAVQWVVMVALAAGALALMVFIGVRRMLMPYAQAARHLQARIVVSAFQDHPVVLATQSMQARRSQAIARLRQGTQALEALDHDA